MDVSDGLVAVGGSVRVRRQRWRVSEVRPYQACELLTLVGTDPSNLGRSCQVLTPFDRVQLLRSSFDLKRVGLRQWRRTCGLLIADHGDPSTLRTARQARIDLLPYQLEPALAVVTGLGSRVLIADEVGLGKTIQAALVLAELKARGAAERILILTPPGLRDQWRGELAARFSLHAAVFDMPYLRRRAAVLPVGINPWSTIPIAIVSIDFAKRRDILTAIRSCRWDIVVVDEAHGVVPGSDRYEAVATLAAAAPYVLLLTATPHSGNRLAFGSLCRLGDNATDTLLVFRRNRQQAGLSAKRRKHRLLVRLTVEERRMHELLDRFIRVVRDERSDHDRDLSLALATLQKRALSSARSLERSVVHRLAVLSRDRLQSPHQIDLPFDDLNGELDDADEVPAWTSAGLKDVEQERRLLGALADAARIAASHEAKLGTLTRLLRRLCAKREQAIVFTEYRDTLLHMRDTLPYGCTVLHGGMTSEERRAALDDFAAGKKGILLATDAAGEGLNLHRACRIVVNLELPWNPVRLEQRAGRVDRIGQARTVHAFHLIARETAETRILERLASRIATAREDIGAADPLCASADPPDVSLPDLVVTEQEPDNRPFDHGFPGGQIYERPQLEAQASAEHARLATVRALTDQENQFALVTGGPSLLAFTRRAGVRFRLGLQTLAVVQSVVEDGGGRVIASRLTPELVRMVNRLSRSAGREAVDRVWPAFQKAALELANQSNLNWEHEVAEVHGRFLGTRIRREGAIAAAALREGRGTCQPGLFDRRALAQHLASADERREFLDDLTRCQDDLRQRALAGRMTVRVALILVP